VSKNRSCPCGLGDAFAECCGRLHAGESRAATAEQLMRSRYAAFALGDADYLLATWHSSTRPAELDLDPEQRWIGLEVLDRSGGGPFDTEGTVRFRAHYRLHGENGALTEHSRFRRVEGQWLYVDGDHD
jgi:SEC-C motif domain protein